MLEAIDSGEVAASRGVVYVQVIGRIVTEQSPNQRFQFFSGTGVGIDHIPRRIERSHRELTILQ